MAAVASRKSAGAGIASHQAVDYWKNGKMRAVSFNIDTAKLMGISTDWIIAVTFALGSALAAAGGVLIGMQIPKIDPLMGILYGLNVLGAIHCTAAVKPSMVERGGGRIINQASAGAFQRSTTRSPARKRRRP